jgi:hypothetical protein
LSNSCCQSLLDMRYECDVDRLREKRNDKEQIRKSRIDDGLWWGVL